VPGHWEGDLIIGKKNLTAIGTLVERTTGYTMVRYKAEQVRDVLAAKIQTLPQQLRASLTWDQGPELPRTGGASASRHRHLLLRPARALATRDQREHQRPLAPALSESTDLSVHAVADLDAVAAELNDRPRKRLAFAKPTEELGPLLLR
jgi:IS30 family transposase